MSTKTDISRSRQRPRRLLRRRRPRSLRGAVYAESLLVMFTMILLLYLIEFVHSGYSKAILSATETRGHGWNHVMEPCKEDVPEPTVQEPRGAWGLGAFSSLAFLRDLGTIFRRYQPATPIRYPKLLTFNVPQHRFSQSDTVTRPTALGGDARFGHQIVLSCNEDPDDLELSSAEFGVWVEAAYRLQRSRLD